MKKISYFAIPLLTFTMLAACSPGGEEPNDDSVKKQEEQVEQVEKTEPTNTIVNEEMKYTVYRSDSNAMNLEVEKKEMNKENTVDKTKQDDFAKFLFSELKTSPSDENVYTTVPVEVELLNVTINEDELNLDFNDKVLTSVMGSTGEMLFVESVNKTMFENIKDIHTITYSINGKPAKTLSHLDVSQGFQRQSILQ